MGTGKQVKSEPLVTRTWSKSTVRKLLGLNKNTEVLPNGKPLKSMRFTVSRNFADFLIMESEHLMQKLNSITHLSDTNS